MPWEVVVLVLGIILIASVRKVLTTRYRAMHNIIVDEDGNEHRLARPDSGQADEVRRLKERVAVLERVVTEDRGSRELSQEIERLREQ